jgi:hypothetical protein
MTFKYNVTLRPYGDAPDAGIVQIDTAARYGYWEHRHGSEGGGLWFEPAPVRAADQLPLALVDYDGSYYLPAPVVRALRAAGIVIDPEFDQAA